jgi:hypothetical protein
MTRSLVLARGRQAAEAGMVDTCSIRRSTGEVTDDYSGVITPTFESLYEGKCRLQQSQAEAQPMNVGEAYVLIQKIELQLPISVVGLQVGDEVTIISAKNDQDLVGLVFLLRDFPRKTDATARRVLVQEKTS